MPSPLECAVVKPHADVEHVAPSVEIALADTLLRFISCTRGVVLSLTLPLLAVLLHLANAHLLLLLGFFHSHLGSGTERAALSVRCNITIAAKTGEKSRRLCAEWFHVSAASSCRVGQ